MKRPGPTPPKPVRRVRLNDSPLPNEPAVGRSLANSELSKLEQSFVQFYTSHYNQLRAAIEAGYPAARAHVHARNLLKKEEVRRAVAEVERQRLTRLRVDGDYLLNRILQIALADPNELVELWVPPCRHCYGKNFMHQRTFGEMEQALELYSRGYVVLTSGEVRRRRKEDPPFDELGGDGYDQDQPPNPACPHCMGRGGKPVVHFKDSRFLSADGRALYAGARITSDRVEVLQRSQDAAWSFIARMAERWLDAKENERSRLRTFDPELMSVEELQGVVQAARDMGLKVDVSPDEDEEDQL